MALQLHLPGHLRPRWRDLPRLATLLQRRLGPTPVHPLTRPAACWLWLLTLATQHAAGRLLAHDTPPSPSPAPASPSPAGPPTRPSSQQGSPHISPGSGFLSR
ncbi:hypothetical protein ACFXJO_03590 [Streptomyces lavendulae]|uniref:hypothetical protein n=1 Tax=Streptomyces lavendulae TaxID=1914 RepID=UPI0036B62389